LTAHNVERPDFRGIFRQNHDRRDARSWFARTTSASLGTDRPPGTRNDDSKRLAARFDIVAPPQRR
jgi:hypothetical protein